MAKKIAKNANAGLPGLLIWVVGALVSLAVGFGMISGILTVPYVQVAVPIAGWIVVIGTVISVIAAIVKAMK